MSEWRSATIGEVARLDIEPTEVIADSCYPIVGVLNRGRGLLMRDSIRGSDTAYKTLNLVRPGQIVYSRLKAFEGAITVVPRSAGEAFASQEFPTFTCSADLMPEFFRLLTTTRELWNTLQNLSTGMGGRRERVKPAAFLTIPVFIPPLAEQRRIVTVMSTVDDQIEAVGAEAAKALGLLASCRTEFSRVDERVPMAALAADRGIQIGPFGSQLHAHDYTESGTPVVMPQDLVGGRISVDKIKRVGQEMVRKLSKHKLRPGDIVFPRRGDLTKRALVTADQDGWLCGTGCLRFRAAKLGQAAHLFEALSNNFTSEWLIEHAVGTTMLNLNTEILGKLPVPAVGDHADLAEACIGAAAFHRALSAELAALRTVRADLLSALVSQEIAVDAAMDKFVKAA